MTTPGDPTAIRIERTYAAPAGDAFEAWTSGGLPRRWYPPGADRDTPVAEVGVGGRLRLMTPSPDGEAFREVTPPSRPVFAWAWDRPDVARGRQLGLADQRSRASHRDGRAGSFDNLARVLPR